MDQYTHAENEYKKASAAYDAATKEAISLVRSLEQVLPGLRGDDWQRFLVANVGVDFPPEQAFAWSYLDGTSIPERLCFLYVRRRPWTWANSRANVLESRGFPQPP